MASAQVSAQHRLAPGRCVLCTQWMLIPWHLLLSLKFKWGLSSRKTGLPTSQHPPRTLCPLLIKPYAPYCPLLIKPVHLIWRRTRPAATELRPHFLFNKFHRSLFQLLVCAGYSPAKSGSKLPRRPDTPSPVPVLSQFPKLYRELETVKAA